MKDCVWVEKWFYVKPSQHSQNGGVWVSTLECAGCCSSWGGARGTRGAGDLGLRRGACSPGRVLLKGVGSGGNSSGGSNIQMITVSLVLSFLWPTAIVTRSKAASSLREI